MYNSMVWEVWKKKCCSVSFETSVRILGRKCNYNSLTFEFPQVSTQTWNVHLSRAIHVDDLFCALTDLLCSLFQTPSLSLQTSCRFKVGWNLLHRSNCWPGNGPATLFLFFLPPERCCPYQLSHNNLCWDCRLCIVWTAGGNGLRFFIFLYKNYFHLQQQLEAKSELLLLCTCVVVGAGGLTMTCGPTGVHRLRGIQC